MTRVNVGLHAAWNSSRKGAWAGRGFHFQHIVSVALLVRQWAGLLPAAHLVPEGLDDCVIESSQHDIWIQIKSKKSGVFSEAEVQKHLNRLYELVALSASKANTYTCLILEQPRANGIENGVENLFATEQRNVVCFNDPWSDAIGQVSSILQVKEVIAEGIVNDLYLLVAQFSSENASLAFDDRRRISVSDVESRISERLEAQDPSSIEDAISKHCCPVNFHSRES